MRIAPALLILVSTFLAGCAWEGHTAEFVDTIPFPPGHTFRDVHVSEPERRGDEPEAVVLLRYPPTTPMWKLVQDLRVILDDNGWTIHSVSEPSQTPDGGSTAEEGSLVAAVDNKYARWEIRCGAGREPSGEAALVCRVVPDEKIASDGYDSDARR